MFAFIFWTSTCIDSWHIYVWLHYKISVILWESPHGFFSFPCQRSSDLDVQCVFCTEERAVIHAYILLLMAVYVSSHYCCLLSQRMHAYSLGHIPSKFSRTCSYSWNGWLHLLTPKRFWRCFHGSAHTAENVSISSPLSHLDVVAWLVFIHLNIFSGSILLLFFS